MQTQEEMEVQKPQTSNPTKGQNGGNKNKKKFDRSQKFREVTGDKYMVENQKRLDERLCADFGGLELYLKQVSVEERTTAVLLPVTTRGTVLALNSAIDGLRRLLPRLQIPYDSLYRTTLLQVEYKLWLAGREQFADCPAAISGAYPLPTLPHEVREHVEAAPRNLSVVTGIVNNFGNFKYGTDTFYARPDPTDLGMTFTKCEAYCREAENVALTPENEIRRVEATVPLVTWASGIAPAPVAVAGAPGIPFCYATAVPIPANYGTRDVYNDLSITQSFISAVTRKFPKLGGTIEYTPAGSPAQLVSCASVSLSVEPDTAQTSAGPDYFWSPRKLDKPLKVVGAFMLCGENSGQAPIRSEDVGCDSFAKSYESVQLALNS